MTFLVDISTIFDRFVYNWLHSNSQCIDMIIAVPPGSGGKQTYMQHTVHLQSVRGLTLPVQFRKF
jgi:hypothetical protein